MTLPPLVERELRVAARRERTYWVRLAVALVFLCFSWAGLLARNSSGAPQTGRDLFSFLAWLAWILCLFEGVRHTADCLSAEKREGTLGLLFLTDLRSRDVVLGKLAPAALQTVYGLLAVVPVLGLPLLSGGVTGGEVARVALALLATLGLSLTTGLLLSALCEEAGSSWAAALGVLAFTVWLPGLTLSLAFAGSKGTNWSEYGLFLLVTVALSLAWLWRTIRILPTSWQTRAVTPASPPLRHEGTVAASAPRQRAPRRRLWRPFAEQILLERDPTLWLAMRGRHSSPASWLLWCLPLGVAGSVSVVLGGPVLMIPMVLVSGGFAVGLLALVTWAACQGMADLRRSGLLDALLTTPLPTGSIPSAWRRALWERFAVPAGMVLITQTLVPLGLLMQLEAGESWFWTLLVLGAADLWLVGQFVGMAGAGMYFGFKSGHAVGAFGKTLLWTLLLPLLSLPAMACTGVAAIPFLVAAPYLIGSVFSTWLREDFARLAAEPSGTRS